MFCVNKEKKRKRELAGQKRERGLRLRPKGVVFFIYFICVLHLLYVSSILLALCVFHIVGVRLYGVCVVFFIYFICVLHLLYVSAILFSAFIVFAFLIYFIYLPFCFLHLLCLFSSILFSCCPYLSMYVYIHIHSLCIEINKISLWTKKRGRLIFFFQNMTWVVNV